MKKYCPVCHFEQASTDPFWQCPRCRQQQIYDEIDTRSQFAKNLGGWDALRILVAIGLVISSLYNIYVNNVAVGREGFIWYYEFSFTAQPAMFTFFIMVKVVVAIYLVKNIKLKTLFRCS